MIFVSGHCSVIELLVNLHSDVNVQDEDGDTSLHLVIIKRGNLTNEVQQATSPDIYAIYEELHHITEHRLAIAIACYLVRVGCSWETLNSKSHTALDYLILDPAKCELIKSYKRDAINANQTNTNNDSNRQAEDILNRSTDDLTNKRIQQHRRNTSEGFNVTVECSPVKQNSSRREKSIDRSASTANGSRNRTPSNNREETSTSNRSRDGSRNREEPQSARKPVECQICSDLSEENVTLEPCGHKPACEDCVARLKKCLRCGAVVQKRVTKDGRVIPPQSKQPSAERMRYLECKVSYNFEFNLLKLVVYLIRLFGGNLHRLKDKIKQSIYNSSSRPGLRHEGGYRRWQCCQIFLGSASAFMSPAASDF